MSYTLNYQNKLAAAAKLVAGEITKPIQDDPTNEGLDMVATELLTKQLDAVTHNIEAIEILIAEYPFKNIDQRLRLRELQILYRGMAKCLDGAVKMFE